MFNFYSLFLYKFFFSDYNLNIFGGGSVNSDNSGQKGPSDNPQGLYNKGPGGGGPNSYLNSTISQSEDYKQKRSRRSKEEIENERKWPNIIREEKVNQK